MPTLNPQPQPFDVESPEDLERYRNASNEERWQLFDTLTGAQLKRFAATLEAERVKQLNALHARQRDRESYDTYLKIVEPRPASRNT